MRSLRLFQIVNEGAIEDVDGDEVLGWGVRFPSGLLVLDWRLEAFPEEIRLEEPHLSLYGSLEDLEVAIGGRVEDLYIGEPTGFSVQNPRGSPPENRPPDPSNGPKSAKSGVNHD